MNSRVLLEYVQSFFELHYPLIIAFASGAIAGIMTFANDFTDKPSALIKSRWCIAYISLNGLMSVVIFFILCKMNITIFSKSINDFPVLMPFLIGLGWFRFLVAPRFNDESSMLTSQSLIGFFKDAKKYLYRHYSMENMSILRPEVWKIVSDINDSDFYNFSIQCIQLAKNISAEEGIILGENYSGYKKNSTNINDYKCEISVDIAKIIGLSLLKQVSVEIKNSPSVADDIEKLDDNLQKLDDKFKEVQYDG